jgi:hypothetical protein
MKFIFMTIILASCSTWERRFASYVSCPPEEIKVIKRGDNLTGYQAHAISCREVVYHCTEKMIDYRPTDLRCARIRNPSRDIASEEE